MRNTTQISWPAALSICVFIAAILRLYRLGAQSLWFDEGTTLVMSESRSIGEHLAFLLQLATGGERFQPLYNVIMRGWRGLFGDDEFGLRSFSALAGTGAVAVVTLTARRLYGERSALAVGLLAATSSFGIFYSQEARPYALLLLIATLVTWFAVPSLLGTEEESPSSKWGSALTLLIGGFASVFVVMYVGSISLAHLVVTRKFGPWLKWWWPTILACLPAFYLYFGNDLAGNPAEKITVTRYGFPVVESLAFVVYGVTVGLTYGPSVASLHGAHRWDAVASHSGELIVLALVLVGITGSIFYAAFGSPATDRRSSLTLIVTTLISLTLATTLAILTEVTWLPRHSFFLWVPMLLLLPLVLRHPGGIAGRAMLASFGFLNLYSANKHYHVYEHSKEDYRGVARFVAEQKVGNQPPVLLYGYIRLLRTYGDERTVELQPHQPSELADVLDQELKGSDEFLAVLTHRAFWETTAGATIEDVLEGRYVLEPIREFQNIEVFVVRREAPSAEPPPRREGHP